MKKMLLAPMLVLALATPAHAQTTVTGTIEYGNPASKAIGGVTEREGGCDPSSDWQGFDGWWVDLEAGVGGSPATLTSDGIDTDVWFFDEACALIGTSADPVAYDMATDGTADESGTIPAGAVYAVVDLAVGYAAEFTFTVG